MIIAYHVIFTTYGTWLPNDPRGSYSKNVYIDQLKLLGEVKYGRQNPQPPKPKLYKFWAAARNKMSRPPFFINDNSRKLIAESFDEVVERLKINVPACVIMNDHVHIIFLRTDYKIQYVVNQLKGAATRKMNLKQTPWTRGCWKVFIDDPDALKSAIDYINANPTKSGLPTQSWDFVKPLDIQT